MLEFVNSDLYFVQDKNGFINPLLQVEKSTGSGGPKITRSSSLPRATTIFYIFCVLVVEMEKGSRSLRHR